LHENTPVTHHKDGSSTVRVTKLREAVLSTGKPAYYIAAQAGIHHSTFSLYMIGRKPIKVDHLANLCKVFNCEPDFLMGWSDYRVGPNGEITPLDDPP
jgi:transcriptional regulator with XRE-family HTH domain